LKKYLLSFCTVKHCYDDHGSNKFMFTTDKTLLKFGSQRVRYSCLKNLDLEWSLLRDGRFPEVRICLHRFYCGWPRINFCTLSPQEGYIVLKNNKNWSTSLNESVFAGEISYTSLSMATVIFGLTVQLDLVICDR